MVDVVVGAVVVVVVFFIVVVVVVFAGFAGTLVVKVAVAVAIKNVSVMLFL